jgi:hypothetical protein
MSTEEILFASAASGITGQSQLRQTVRALTIGTYNVNDITHFNKDDLNHTNIL